MIARLRALFTRRRRILGTMTVTLADMSSVSGIETPRRNFSA